MCKISVIEKLFINLKVVPIAFIALFQPKPLLRRCFQP